jgi:hypothetical protein
MFANLFELLRNPIVWIALAALVYLQWDRIKPLLDKFRGTDGTLRDKILEVLQELATPDAEPQAIEAGPVIRPAVLFDDEQALDDAVHNWLLLRRGAADPTKLDELFSSFPKTYLEPKPVTNAT